MPPDITPVQYGLVIAYALGTSVLCYVCYLFGRRGAG
jgi:hypothetical protein